MHYLADKFSSLLVWNTSKVGTNVDYLIIIIIIIITTKNRPTCRHILVPLKNTLTISGSVSLCTASRWLKTHLRQEFIPFCDGYRTETKNRGFCQSRGEPIPSFLEPCKRFQPRQFWAGCLENAAYMQSVAHSIQGLNMQTISDTPTCTHSQF